MNNQRVEKILDNRLTSYGGSLLVMPLLLLIVLFGTISYSAARQRDRIIEKILTPPTHHQNVRAQFTDATASARFEAVLPDFVADLERRIDAAIPRTDETEIVPVVRERQQQIRLDQVRPAIRLATTQPAVDAPGQGVYDPSAEMAAQGTDQEGLVAINRSTAGAGQQTATTEPIAGQVDFGGSTAGEVSPQMLASGNGLKDAVMIHRGASAASHGVGIEKPVSEERQNLSRWILRNQSPLRPAVQTALGYSALKEDLTSAGQVLDETGGLYRLFFLYRHENNLLRILVVHDQIAYRIDLPDFYLQANHVQKGEVSFDSGEHAGIIEVSLSSVPEIPAEVPQLFEIVLQWLEIKTKK